MNKWKEILGYRYKLDGKTWVLEWDWDFNHGSTFKYFPTERDLTEFVRDIVKNGF
jgi:hypothetical protein